MPDPIDAEIIDALRTTVSHTVHEDVARIIVTSGGWDVRAVDLRGVPAPDLDGATVAFLPHATAAAKTKALALLTPKTVHGVCIGNDGWPGAVPFKPKMIHAYDAGRELVAVLEGQVDTAIRTYPGAPVMLSIKLAGRGYTTAQYAALGAATRARADKVPSFIIAVNSEPDRKASSTGPYIPRIDPAVLATAIRAYKNGVGPHPNVRWCLSLTGSQFLARIPTWAASVPLCDVLAVDPYWYAGVPGDRVQASEKDLTDAAAWCKTNHKDLALAEWGVQRGADQTANVIRALEAIRAVAPIVAPLYHDATAGPFDCSMSADALATYKRLTGAS